MTTFEFNMNRKYLFIIISAIALLGVLLIQLNWIVKAAKLKEELFNEKAKIVLAKTSEAIGKNEKTCRAIGESIEEEAPTSNRSQFDEIDSLFHFYMAFYKIDMDYSYEIISPSPVKEDNEYATERIFNQEFENNSFLNNIQLKLIFPDQSQFLLAEMGLLFFTSIGLMLIVLLFFFLTIKYLLQEKAIAEQTSEFLNNMTHEFKTPLTNIGLAIKMIGKKINPNNDHQISRYTDIIKFEKNKLSLQVEQVLGIASLDKSNALINLEPINFHELVLVASEALSLQLKERGGTIELQLNATNPDINGDRTHLLNTLCNLLDNAIKYSAKIPQITIFLRNYNNGIELRVTDNGIGIEKQHINKIFEKYYRAQKGNIHDVKGFGIGLAYVKKIIELHNGNINVQSTLGKGSTFTIQLPHIQTND